jgi:hypothetical protein
MARNSTPPKSATAKKARRNARKSPASAASKLDRIVSALRGAKGVTIPDLMELTGWQAHSVRGALSGALKKKRGLTIHSEQRNGARTYKIASR